MARSINRPKSSRQTQSSRAGLLFPVSRFVRKMKLMPQSTQRFSKTAGVYMTAVIEYLMGLNDDLFCVDLYLIASDLLQLIV